MFFVIPSGYSFQQKASFCRIGLEFESGATLNSIRPGSMASFVRLSSFVEYCMKSGHQIVKGKSTCKSHLVNMVRKFEEWWNSVPVDLRQKSRKGDEANKPLLNQVNYVLLHLHLSGKHDLKPSHAELKDWLHSGQVDVLRMTKKQRELGEQFVLAPLL